MLQDDYPLDMLPVEWGGKAGTMEELNRKYKKNIQYKYSYIYKNIVFILTSMISLR